MARSYIQLLYRLGSFPTKHVPLISPIHPVLLSLLCDYLYIFSRWLLEIKVYPESVGGYLFNQLKKYKQPYIIVQHQTYHFNLFSWIPKVLLDFLLGRRDNQVDSHLCEPFNQTQFLSFPTLTVIFPRPIQVSLSLKCFSSCFWSTCPLVSLHSPISTPVCLYLLWWLWAMISDLLSNLLQNWSPLESNWYFLWGKFKK